MLLLLVCQHNQTVARFSQSKFLFTLTAPTGNYVRTIVERHTKVDVMKLLQVKQENCHSEIKTHLHEQTSNRVFQDAKRACL